MDERGRGRELVPCAAHPAALERIADCLEATGHGADLAGPLFRESKPTSTPLDSVTKIVPSSPVLTRYASAPLRKMITNQ
jgi:hypothetical protein